MTEGLLFAANLANDEYIAVYGYAINRVSRFTSGVDGEIYLFNLIMKYGDQLANFSKTEWGKVVVDVIN